MLIMCEQVIFSSPVDWCDPELQLIWFHINKYNIISYTAKNNSKTWLMQTNSVPSILSGMDNYAG